MCALTTGAVKGLWTYLAQTNGAFQVYDVAKAMEMEYGLLGEFLIGSSG